AHSGPLLRVLMRQEHRALPSEVLTHFIPMVQWEGKFPRQEGTCVDKADQYCYILAYERDDYRF
ncbi:MAG TPA: hypothetical protein VEO56_03680, partial [Bacteroidota bacterium]|nr:hypothetical protein [Bacteroidota bacterium]